MLCAVLGIVPIVAWLEGFAVRRLVWHLLSLNKERSSALERRSGSYYFAKRNTLAQINMCYFVLQYTEPAGWCVIPFKTRRVIYRMVKNPTK